MKTPKRSALIRILALAALIAALCCVIPHAASAEIDYYCRSAIAKLPNSAALLYAYDRIAEGVALQQESISVYNGTDALSADEFKTVFSAYQYDHTECFWLGNNCSISSNSSTVLSVKPNYVFTGSELTKAKSKFDDAAKDILSRIDVSASDFEKEKALHDILAQRISYVTSAKNAHNAYGALVDGEAVCEGYAKAFQYLLQKLGIQSAIVIGESRGIAHGWNVVKIGGDWYHVDLTWDDQDSNIYYAYFNKTDSVIKEDHIIYDVGFDMPKCTATRYDYYEYKGGKMASFDAKKIADLLKSNNFKARVYITGSTDSFKSALADSNNWLKIAEFAGVKGQFGVSYSSLGREFILSMTVSSQPVETSSSQSSDVTYETSSEASSETSSKTSNETSSADESSHFNESSSTSAVSDVSSEPPSPPESSEIGQTSSAPEISKDPDVSSEPTASGDVSNAGSQTSDSSQASSKPEASSDPDASSGPAISGTDGESETVSRSQTSETGDTSSPADQSDAWQSSVTPDGTPVSSASPSQSQDSDNGGDSTVLIVVSAAAAVIAAAVIMIIIKRKRK